MPRIFAVLIWAWTLDASHARAEPRPGRFHADRVFDPAELQPSARAACEGIERSCQTGVHPLKHSTFRPWLAGASVAVDVHGGGVWVADSDNHTVAVSDGAGTTVLRVLPVGGAPEQVVVGPDGRGFVTLRSSGELVVLSPKAARVDARVPLGGEPFGLALSPDGKLLFVSLAHDGVVVGLDAATLVERFRRPVDAEPRGMACAPDGDKLFVAHLTGRAVSVLDLAGPVLQTMPKLRTITLPTLPGGRNGFAQLVRPMAGRVPNLTFAVALSPGGRRLYVPHVLEDTGQDIAPAARSGGYGAGTSMPIVATLTAVDADCEEPHLASDSVGFGRFGGGLFGLSQPRAVVADPMRSRLFVAGLGSDAIMSLSSAASDPSQAPLERISLRRGSGAKGLAVSADGKRLYVHASLKHQLAVFDIGADRGARALAQLTIGEEKLPPAAVHGRELFFAGQDRRISSSGLACASCHPEGRQDGLTWRLDQGPRQTPSLAGRLVGTAPFNWRGSQETLQGNMKETMGRLGGRGLPKKDLADLELFLTHYLEEVAPSPRPSSVLAERGRAIFESDEVGCAHCHAPKAQFTDGRNHDIGTIAREEVARLIADQGKPVAAEPVHLETVERAVLRAVVTTGVLRAIGGNLALSADERLDAERMLVDLIEPRRANRLQAMQRAFALGRPSHTSGGQALSPRSVKPHPDPSPGRLAYNTPSLVGVGRSAPYFHDGSARTLREVVTTANPGDRMGRTSQLAPDQLDALVAYLETL